MRALEEQVGIAFGGKTHAAVDLDIGPGIVDCRARGEHAGSGNFAGIVQTIAKTDRSVSIALPPQLRARPCRRIDA